MPEKRDWSKVIVQPNAYFEKGEIMKCPESCQTELKNKLNRGTAFGGLLIFCMLLAIVVASLNSSWSQEVEKVEVLQKDHATLQNEAIADRKDMEYLIKAVDQIVVDVKAARIEQNKISKGIIIINKNIKILHPEANGSLTDIDDGG